MIRFKKTDLKNGIRVVSELHSESRAVSLGIWVTTGTRDEKPDEAGISHFLEHMVFKNTKTRSAFQIAKSLEAVGGELNAFTTREYTCYHALVLKDHWHKGMDVLSDLVNNMEMKREDFSLEKSVIMQEIGMGEDNIEELVYDLYLEEALPKHPLGRPILGNVASVGKMTQKKLQSYYKEKYSGQNIIVSAAGNIDHEELVKAVEQYLGSKQKRRFYQNRTRPKAKVFRKVVEKPSEQLHVLLGLPCSSYKDRNRFEAFIVNALLGGGMTSKLYQSVREKRGLVYSIYSTLNTFDDFGMINIYSSCEPKNMRSVVKNISSELKRVRKQGVTNSDLEMFKTQVNGSVLLGADDVENRMQSVAVNEMVFKKYKPVDAIVDEINKVTSKSVHQFIDKYLDLDQVSGLLVGKDSMEHKDWFMDFNFKK